MNHSKPRLMRVGGSTTSSPATVALAGRAGVRAACCTADVNAGDNTHVRMSNRQNLTLRTGRIIGSGYDDREKGVQMTKWITGLLVVAVLSAVASLGVSAQQNQMSFFITSAGPGNGANLGGLAGADKVCQTLAAAAGAGNRTWRAYLSAAAAAGQPAVNARDRIGKGPWMNAKGVV